MYELYQRKQLDNRNWHETYFAYAKWWPLRNIVQSSFLTSWIGDLVPQLSNNFRYTFNTNLNDPITNPRKALAWTDRLKAILPWQSSTNEQIFEHQSLAHGSLPLNITNFVDVVASALERLKTEVLKTHNISITSAVIATPYWINNDIDRLVERACLKTKLEILDKRERAEAARYIPFKAGKAESLVLEQCGYDFRLSKPLSSMRRDDLSSSWIPARLTSEMLESLGFVTNGTVESLNAATQSLAIEIAKTRQILRYAYAKEPELFNKEESTIVVPNFGSNDFTFEQSLPGANISRIEKAYTGKVQRAVETMLLKRQEIQKYQKDNNLLDDLENDGEVLEAAAVDLAKTVSHPQAASGGSWWDSIDAVLVIADFPDNGLIQRAAVRAIGSIPSIECSNVFSPAYVQYDLVARGAALEASIWIGYWENKERERRCSGDDNPYECWNNKNEEEEEVDEEVEHEEL
jgi:hypothetical protein